MSKDRIVKVWDRATGKCLQTLKRHSELMWWSVDLSGDSTQESSASKDKTINLWDSAKSQNQRMAVGQASLNIVFDMMVKKMKSVA